MAIRNCAKTFSDKFDAVLEIFMQISYYKK